MAPQKNSLSYALRAAISSACIFPGAGLFLLRRYVRGCIFAIPAAWIVLMLFANVFSTAFAINAELQRQADEGNYAFDVVAIFHQLHSALFTSPYWQDGKWILLASWLLSIISSYFVGKKLDMQTQAEIK